MLNIGIYSAMKGRGEWVDLDPLRLGPRLSRRRGAGRLNEWFEADSIVHGISKLLLAAKVSLSCSNADVPEQELDLVKLSTGIMAQARARPSQIMRSDVL